MIVDTSALVAIISGEEDADRFVRALADHDEVWIAPGTLVELSTVLWRRFGADEAVVKSVLDEYGITIGPFGEQQAWAAAQAYRRWGPGTGTGARLNFGDCLSYALADVTGQALLYKGDDFARTDVRAALEEARD